MSPEEFSRVVIKTLKNRRKNLLDYPTGLVPSDWAAISSELGNWTHYQTVRFAKEHYDQINEIVRRSL